MRADCLTFYRVQVNKSSAEVGILGA
jgi:hypothetical protein